MSQKLNLTKSLAILLNVALVGTSFADVGLPGVASSAAAPDFVRTLTPPTELGYITGFYKGETENPVILIQDLHANYGVQKKIENILEFLQPKVAPAGQPMVLGIEGAWGKMNLANVRNVAEKIRRKAADILLTQAEISGMEHFAAMSAAPVEFVGIDNPEDYIVHRELFRKSLAARLELATKVDQLRDAVNQAKADGPRALRHIWKLADDFHSGKIDLDGLSKALGLQTPLANYGDAEAAIANAQSSYVSQDTSDKAFEMRNIVAADQSLELLSRLFRQQLTLEEVQYVSSRIPKILVVVQGLLPGENLQLWEDTIRSSIDHYAVALLRDQPMSAHAEALAKEHANESVVIVSGGFHTAGVAQDLQQKKMSYVIIAPIVESQTARDERLYLKRMMGIPATGTEMSQSVKANAGAGTLGISGVVSSEGEQAAGTALNPEMQRSAAEWPAMVGAVEAGAVPPTTLTAGQVQMADAIDAAVPETQTQSPSSLVARAKTLLSQPLIKLGILNSPAPVSVTATAQNAVDVKLDSSGPGLLKPAAQAGVALVAVGGISSVLGQVNIAAQTGHQFVHTAVANATSSPLAFAAGMASPGHIAGAIGAIAVAGGVWFFGTNKGRKQLEDARQRVLQAAYKLQA